MAKISKKLIRNYRRSRFRKLIDFTDTKIAKARLKKVSPQLADYLSKGNEDPNHKLYFAIQTQLSFFAEEASVLNDFREYYDLVEKMEDNYMPGYPPMSPLTNSYFTYWACCDCRFGAEKESVATIFHDIVTARYFDETVLEALTNLSKSCMRFYKHLGFDGHFSLLQDILTGEIFPSISTSGFKGIKGQIWFIRLAPSLDGINDYQICMTTPYVIINYSEKEWLAFFERQGIHKAVADYEQRYSAFMKQHPIDDYWQEYIMDAYFNFTPNYILLTGIPDIKGSKPHEMTDD